MFQVAGILILGAWFVLSVANQIPGPMKEYLGAHDPFGFLPQWSFFAPNPGTSDSRLVYRESRDAQHWSGWIELESPPACKAPRWLFNPNKAETKALADLSQMVLATWSDLDQNNKQGTILSWPYIALLRTVMKQRPDSEPGFRQFALVMSKGHEAPRELQVVFVSAAHKTK